MSSRSSSAPRRSADCTVVPWSTSTRPQRAAASPRCCTCCSDTSAVSGSTRRWLVIAGRARTFFDVTKRIHNHLYGGAGRRRRRSGRDEHEVYEATLAPERDDARFARSRRATSSSSTIRRPAGLAEHAKQLGCHVVWRCHVGIEEQNDHSRLGLGVPPPVSRTVRRPLRVHRSPVPARLGPRRPATRRSGRRSTRSLRRTRTWRPRPSRRSSPTSG